jgi:hypothetical protein
MAILSRFQDFFYSLNEQANREPDLSAIRLSALFSLLIRSTAPNPDF